MQRRWKCRRIAINTIAAEVCGACSLPIDGARTRIDNQLLPGVRISEGSIAQRMIGIVSVFTLKLEELIPAGLLVRQVDAPLDIDQRARIPAAFDLITQL